MSKKLLPLLLLLSFSILLFSCVEPEDEEDLTPPDAPTNLIFDANLSGDGQIYISWTAPGDNDVATYHIYRDASTGTFSELTSTTGINYLDINLDYSIEYSYKITAKDDSGNESPFSNTVSLTPVNLYSPATPAGLEISAHNIPDDFLVNVELKWEANSEADFAYYKIFRSSTSPLFLPDENSLLDSVTNTSYADEEVIPGNTYHYKLVAYDLGHKGSDPTIVVSDTPLEVPTLVRPINDVANTSLTPTFEWTNVNAAVKYRLIVRTSSNTGDIWIHDVTATTANTMSVVYPSNATTPLQSNDTRYWWFIAGYSKDTDEINVYSEDATFKTQ